MKHVLTVLTVLVLAAPLSAQTLPPIAKSVSLSGPRFGVTMLGAGVVAKLAERDIEVTSAVSQFGWQFEKQVFSTRSGVTAVTEWVNLVGGLEQSVVLPSLRWMVGNAGVVNVPVNVAMVPSKAGTRVSVLTGFNMRGRR